MFSDIIWKVREISPQSFLPQVICLLSAPPWLPRIRGQLLRRADPVDRLLSSILGRDNRRPRSGCLGAARACKGYHGHFARAQRVAHTSVAPLSRSGGRSLSLVGWCDKCCVTCMLQGVCEAGSAGVRVRIEAEIVCRGTKRSINLDFVKEGVGKPSASRWQK